MSFFHLLALLIMLIVPVMTALTGYKRMNSTSAFGAKGGYRSERAMVSPASWAFAQKACGIRYLIGGGVMTVLSFMLTFSLPANAAAAQMIIFALVFAGAWIVLDLIMMFLIEGAIMRRHFS